MAPQINLREPQSIPKKKSLWFLLLVLGVTIGAGYLFFIQLPISTTASRFCGATCHSMNPSYQSWRRSDHSNIPCLDCHSDGSKTNRFIKLIELSVKHIPKEGLKSYQPIKVTEHQMVSNETCRRCHKPKKRSQSNGRIIDHKAHADIDLSCKTCHNRVSHEDAPTYSPLSKKSRPGPNYANYMTMIKGCWRCHKKGGIFIDPKGKAHSGPYTIGKLVAPTSCGICHAKYDRKQFSKNVRQVWLSHEKQPKWKQGIVHGQVARKTDFKVCTTCHNPKKRCTVCHEGITMPHKVNWLAATEHGSAAKATKAQPCRLCHDLKQVQSCSANGHHHEEFVVANSLDLEENPWKRGFGSHGPAARATNAQSCQRCHDQATWCATQCHQGIKMPHDPQWRKTHFTVVGYKPGGGWISKPTVCDLCHDANRKNPLFCMICHHKSLVPESEIEAAASPMAIARKRYGVKESLKGGIGPCAKCHAIKFCWRCHEDL